MRTDFTPDNIEFWMSNWKRKDTIDGFVRQWLDTFDFQKINLIANHSSVTIDDFGADIQPRVKIWNNVMRHNDAIGPMNENYNQAYVHTFLSGKKYCICAHDNMLISKGWDDAICQTDYDFYMAPQGDQVHVITLDGLKRYGWWDERYATNGNHELDYITRVLRIDMMLGFNKASIIDFHGWHGWPVRPKTIELEMEDGTSLKLDSPIVTQGHPEFPSFPYLRYNDVGLDQYWKRASKKTIPQTGPKTQNFSKLDWNDRKWNGTSPNTFDNFINGPTDNEIDWYPWLDLYTLEVDKCAIK